MYSQPSSSLWKLSGMMLGVIAFVMMLVWLVTTWTLRHYFDEIGRAIIEDDLREYGAFFERSGADGVGVLFEAGGHGQHDQGLRLIDPVGTVLIDRPIPEPTWTGWPAFPTAKTAGKNGIEWLRAPLEEGSVLTIGRRRLGDGSELWFARTDADDLAAIRQVHLLLLVAIGVAVVLSVGPVVWFASRVLRPVHRLIAGARRLAHSASLDARLEPSEAIAELRVFADAFNESLDRVQALTEELEAANDQLAHELRTPLARIRGNIEGILKARESTPEILEQAARAIEEITRASAIIRDILSIRAGDSGVMRLNLESLSLDALIRETIDLYSASAEEKGLSLTLHPHPPVPRLSLDRQRVQQALCNLLDNAIAYTPAGGQVEVELLLEDGSVVVHVRDSGPGLSGDDPQRIWRRFMRGSAASAANPGIGLGLSLVRAVATAHRGEAGAGNLAGGGADFWIRLPRDSGELPMG